MAKVNDSNAVQNRHQIKNEDDMSGLSAPVRQKVVDAKLNDNILKNIIARNTQMMQKAIQSKRGNQS